MANTKFVGYDRVSDNQNNSVYIIYLKSAFTCKGETYFKKSSLVVNTLPEARVGDTVTVDWKSNTIKKVEVK